MNQHDTKALLPIIRKALQFKQDLVAIDPYDRHQRHVLNAGHTLGHALESAAVQGGLRITHGEAVAAGIVAEAHLSVLMHDFPSDRLQSVTDLVLNQFAKFLSPLPQPEAVLPFLKHDKKNTSGSITSILFDSDQMPVLTAQIPITLVMQSLQYLYKLVHGSDSTC